MRFFKYLVLICLSLISFDALARIEYTANNKDWFVSAVDACIAAHGKTGSWGTTTANATNTRCIGDSGNVLSGITKRTINCPTDGMDSLLVLWLEKGTTRIPTVYCKGTCEYRGNGIATDTPGYTNTALIAQGENLNCKNEYKDDSPPKCDAKDPYGDCYVPPNDNCMRTKDGSIVCPPDTPTPPKNNTCNGATYCKRPPQGCGEGYVSGSFNGEQLCVRSKPNDPKTPPDPDKPEEPDNCMNGGSYCPQPPDNTTCPDGYSETTFNGSKICVRNNPDPEKPNPNDPNNPDYGGGGDNGSGGSEPTDGGDGSTGGSINLKPVIDAINSLKSALLGAISGISGKLDTLINVQKDTNKKLDTSNDHLDKIEDATQATSEAVGETNKKLDSIKDSIDSQTKCLDQGTGKYRECTDDDLKTGPEEDGKVSVLEKEVETNFDANIINASAQCPPPMVIRFNLLQAHEISFSYENFCYGASLARPWVIFVGMLIAFMIVTGQYKGGSDA